MLFLCPARPELTAAAPGLGRRTAQRRPACRSTRWGRPRPSGWCGCCWTSTTCRDGLRRRILERAEGNPFFLEEIVRRLIDEGLIMHEYGRWRAPPGIDDVAIPDTVQGVLAARIDLLPADEKRVAAVRRGGRAGVLAGCGGRAPERRGGCGVEQLLDGLERRDLVLSRLTSSMAGERELIFKHILTRDVAYESLPRRDRPHAHALRRGVDRADATASGGWRSPSCSRTITSWRASVSRRAATRWTPRAAIWGASRSSRRWISRAGPPSSRRRRPTVPPRWRWRARRTTSAATATTPGGSGARRWSCWSRMSRPTPAWSQPSAGGSACWRRGRRA